MKNLMIIFLFCFVPILKAEWKPIEAEVTAYCPCKKCCGKEPNHPAYKITASGHKIKDGDRFIAAPKEIRFQTKLKIEGYNNNKSIKVLDRGGAIKKKGVVYCIDVYFDTHQEALNWGRKRMIIYMWVE